MSDIKGVELKFIPVLNRPDLPRRGIKLIHTLTNTEAICNKHSDVSSNFIEARKILFNKLKER